MQDDTTTILSKIRGDGPDVDRFWAKVDKSNGPESCWEWTGYRDPESYGRIVCKRVTILAHRLAWTFTHGEIPPGLCVLHQCDNPPCVNPAHLFLGTHGDNMRDCAEKGRLDNRQGSSSYCSKLTEKQVLEIRKATGQTQVALARQFGVAQVTISRILSRKSWAHLP